MHRQRQQAQTLFGKNLGDGTIAIIRPWPLVRHLVAPLQRLAVALLQCGERARRPVGIAYEPYRPFHAPFLIAGPHLTRFRLEVVVTGQFQQPRVEMDQTAAALQHSRFQIVVQQDSSGTMERREGVHVAAQEVLHRLVEEELQIQRPRPGQGHYEATQSAPGAAHHDRAKRCPVNLCLFTDEDMKAQKCFLRLRTQPRHHSPHLLDISSEAAVLEHLVQSRGAKPRMRFQRLPHQGKIRIQHRGPQLLGTMKSLHLDGALHRIGMHSERLGDRAHLPVFGVKVAADLHPHLRIDHLLLTCESKCAEKDRPGGWCGRRPYSAAKSFAAHAAELAIEPLPAR